MQVIVKNHSRKSRRGDTLIEVAIAIAAFSFVTALAIGTMNHSAELMQGALELTMTRNEIDAQAEALRFIQNAYLSERELVRTGTDGLEYQEIWDKLTDLSSGFANNPAKISAFNSNQCKTYYQSSSTSIPSGEKNHSLFRDKAFIINTRSLDPRDAGTTIVSSRRGSSDNTSVFNETTLYPRVIYTAPRQADNSDTNLYEKNITYNVLSRAEGIWVIATRDVTGVTNPATATDDYLKRTIPEFYDFYIRGCWYAPGNSYPSTISTIVRLYNPEYMREGSS